MRERKTNGPGRSGSEGGGTAPRRNPEAGFSLLEVSVAIVVLLVGLMGLGQAMIAAYQMERSSEEQKIALRWATSQLEKVRSLTYNEILSPMPAGYFVDTSWSGYYNVGYSFDFDGDGRKDEYFYRMFFSNQNLAPVTLTGTNPFNGSAVSTTVPRADPLLNGLRSMYGDYNYTALVLFREPSTFLSGLPGATGWNVTVWVRWTGVNGPSEMRLSTYVGR